MRASARPSSKKHFRPMRKMGRLSGEISGHELARLAQRQRAGQVFLDRHRIAVVVVCQINNTEPAGRNFLYNAISGNFQPIRQGSVVLRGHVEVFLAITRAIVWINHCFVKNKDRKTLRGLHFELFPA